MASQTPIQDELLAKHLALLNIQTASQSKDEITCAPVFTKAVLDNSQGVFSQYGFFAGISNRLEVGDSDAGKAPDPRLFLNISTPSSAFICGSQGSGKSHTLSCLLENCLIGTGVSELNMPLAGLVFHYDSFTSDLGGTPCEAAYLSSNKNLEVRVLCSPTNFKSIQDTYSLLPNITVDPLLIDQNDLSTERMLSLMAVSTDESTMPLYLHSITRILRNMRMEQQSDGLPFDYAKFKSQVMNSNMTPAQLAPLNQRLDALESFMPKWQTEMQRTHSGLSRKKKVKSGTDWGIKSGSLTIVDLSCPCVTADSACSLFNMCLSIFLEQKTKARIGRVIALDEAHKYMSSSSSTPLTNTLLAAIRLQRHLGTRIFISTQEPTISPKLLDLCSVTIVHRFTSPDWLRCLRSHIAALGTSSPPNDNSAEERDEEASGGPVFDQIVRLRVGEALLFSPSAMVDVQGLQGCGEGGEESKVKIQKLGVGFLKIKVRSRITQDGGQSVLAVGKI